MIVNQKEKVKFVNKKKVTGAKRKVNSRDLQNKSDLQKMQTILKQNTYQSITLFQSTNADSRTASKFTNYRPRPMMNSYNDKQKITKHKLRNFQIDPNANYSMQLQPEEVDKLSIFMPKEKRYSSQMSNYKTQLFKMKAKVVNNYLGETS